MVCKRAVAIDYLCNFLSLELRFLWLMEAPIFLTRFKGFLFSLLNPFLLDIFILDCSLSRIFSRALLSCLSYSLLFGFFNAPYYIYFSYFLDLFVFLLSSYGRTPYESLYFSWDSKKACKSTIVLPPYRSELFWSR